ncbi:Hypothetical protein D9617_18g033090 [Elsinoe fawcettii]|nr:Hypothetical protein D9617_18g033090 [Elsinoe fawcettii]
MGNSYSSRIRSSKKETGSGPATAEVVSNPYLVENILTNLGMKSLLRAEAVCKEWKYIIDRSPVIQRRLFLKEDPRKRILEIAECDHEIGPLGYCRYCPDSISRASRANEDKDKPCQFPAFLAPGALAHKPSNAVGFRNYYKIKSTTLITLTRNMSADARWRKMFVSQPPVKAVSIRYLRYHPGRVHDVFGFPEEYTIEAFDVQNEAGVTVGDVIDRCWSKWQQRNKSHPETQIPMAGVDICQYKDSMSEYFVNPAVGATEDDLEVDDGEQELYYSLWENDIVKTGLWGGWKTLKKGGCEIRKGRLLKVGSN